MSVLTGFISCKQHFKHFWKNTPNSLCVKLLNEGKIIEYILKGNFLASGSFRNVLCSLSYSLSLKESDISFD